MKRERVAKSVASFFEMIHREADGRVLAQEFGVIFALGGDGSVSRKRENRVASRHEFRAGIDVNPPRIAGARESRRAISPARIARPNRPRLRGSAGRAVLGFTTATHLTWCMAVAHPIDPVSPGVRSPCVSGSTHLTRSSPPPRRARSPGAQLVGRRFRQPSRSGAWRCLGWSGNYQRGRLRVPLHDMCRQHPEGFTGCLAISSLPLGDPAANHGSPAVGDRNGR